MNKNQVRRVWWDEPATQGKIRIHRKTIERFEARVRELTNRNSGKGLAQTTKGLNRYLIGWWNYYRLTEARTIFKSLKG